MRRLVPVLHVLGLVILIFSFTMLAPLATAFFAHDAAQHAFDESFAVTLLAGFALWLAGRRWRRELKVRDGFLLVLLVWTGLPAFTTLPFLIYAPGMGFTDAYFEAISALTTTGATVMSGLDGLPPSLNLWRHLLNWLGGMGIIVLAVAILPLLGIGGRQLLKAELPGPINAGPGLNEVGPGTNYAGLDDFQTWVLAFTMLLGRLELFTVFVLFTRAFWRA